MRFRKMRLDAARHRIACFKQRPIKRFPIEGNQHVPRGHARGQLHQQRMLFAIVAHKKLLDLQSPGLPPGEADQKRVRSRATGQPGGFRVQEEPLRWVGETFGERRRNPRYPGFRLRSPNRSEEHTSELQSLAYLVCRLLLEKKKKNNSSTSSAVERSDAPCSCSASDY